MNRTLLYITVIMSLWHLPRPAHAEERRHIWIDLYAGEPVTFETVMEDLAGVQSIYLGEVHRLQRHHELHERIIESLAGRGKKILLGIEQLAFPSQDSLDRFNRGEIDYDQLAKDTNWEEQWKNYRDYQAILEAVRNTGGTIAALNAPVEIIRSVGKKGIENLSAEERAALPSALNFDDPLYEQWLNKQLLVHSQFTPETLRTIFQAQVARDETMAYRLHLAWRQLPDPANWIAVTICGSGHCSYGLGTPARFRRYEPELNDRIVLSSESGDSVLTESEKAMMREIQITHEDLRFLQRPIADYLLAVELGEKQ